MLLLQPRALPAANQLTRRYPLFQIIIIVSIVALLLSTLFISIASSATSTFSSLPDKYWSAAMAKQRALVAYQNLPMSFEANRGQMQDGVRFVSHGSGYSLFLMPTEAVFSLQVSAEGDSPILDRSGSENAEVQYQLLRMALLGSNPLADVVGEMPLQSTSNYFHGNDPARWITNVPHYGQVRYRDIYPGIDLLYHGKQGQLQYDFVLTPGADPSQIRLAFPSASSVELDSNGDLLLHLESDIIRQKAPFTYQTIGGRRVEVASQFVILEDEQIGFEIGSYDPSLPLVIDPTIIYYTSLNSTPEESEPKAITVDSTGAAYFTGSTSGSFPITPGAYDTTRADEDTFITKLNSAGELVFSTFLGGADFYGESGEDIIVGAGNTVYVTGTTTSAGFPTTLGAFSRTLHGHSDVFVIRLAAEGNSLIYSTLIGGDAADFGKSIDVDAAGAAYITGSTGALNFPVTSGAFDTSATNTVGFVTKLNTDGTALIYSTYLGGGNNDNANAIIVDTDGYAYVTGMAGSTNFPTTPGAFQTTHSPGSVTDGFISKLNADGSSLVFSTFIQDAGAGGRSIVLGSDNSVYITGCTTGAGFPTTSGSYDVTYNGSTDVFVTRLAADGASLIYSTFLGGTGKDYGYAVAVDANGTAYTTGYTTSVDFPTVQPIQAELYGYYSAFVTSLSPDGMAIIYSSYLGDSAYNFGSDIAVDQNQDGYVLWRGVSSDPVDTPSPDVVNISKVSFQPNNQPPLNTVPGSQTTAEDTPLTFGAEKVISISDPDAGTNPVQVTLSAANGTLTLSGISGLTFSEGDGTDDATMTFTGTITDINAALDGLTFTPSANFSGSTSLTITTNDQGYTGSGGSKSDTDTVIIVVNPEPGSTIFIVNKTDDHTDGLCDVSDCTLREAINAANANTGQDTITFNIPGTGPHTISPLTPLPEITDPVIIDGTTQPGASCDSWPPTLRIELAGTGTGSDNGLTLSADNSLIRGLVINRFASSWYNSFGIQITGDYNRLECNFIGTDVTGTLALGNGDGVYINRSSYTHIGTNGDGLDDATERNLISGNTYGGIWDSGSYTVIAGNYIGTDVSGTVALGNSNIGVSPGDYSRIGTDANGIADDMERNIISGNGYSGSWIDGGIIFYDETNVTVAGNYIGTDVTGLAPLGNGSGGIVFYANATNNLIGGTSPAASNLIAFNQDVGIYIAWHCADDGCTGHEPPPITHNTIRGNSIHSNGGLGINIDLVAWPQIPDGPLPNDPGDVDEGLNDNQNYPVLTAATSHTVIGALNSQPNSTYVIEFFSQAVCDPSGYGEGEVFRGAINVSTDSSGYTAFTHTFAEPLPVGHVLTSTATNAAGSTSEFSLCAPIIQDNTYTVINRNVSGAGSLHQAILDANAHPGLDTINFNIPGTGSHTILLPLPSIDDPIQIDGCSQPGADCSHWPPSLRIELTSFGGSGNFGIQLFADHSLIRGLVINGFVDYGIWITGDHSRIECNFIGTDITGTTNLSGEWGQGIHLDHSDSNIIGTNGDGIADITERNLISGYNGVGVRLIASHYNIIAGNYIGTDVSGTISLGNEIGLAVANGSDFNRIGTDGNHIADETERNIISSNSWVGLLIVGTSNIVSGNYIGTDVTGQLPLENQENGIVMSQAYNNVIGGISAGTSNIIAFNAQSGILIAPYQSTNNLYPAGSGNIIHGNSIHSNGGLGIDLNTINQYTPDGPTLNDPGDTDTGANEFQNYPVLTAVTPTTVTGTLNSTPNTTFTLDFYSNTVCDESGYGEGELFQPVTEAATVTTDANGDATFSFTFASSIPAGHTAITATATDPAGNTSEFSLCRAIPGSLSIDDVLVLESNRSSAVFTVTLSQASTESITVDYASADDTATAGSDYTAVEGTLIFDPGVTSQPISVPILEDTRDEGDETFVVNLTNPQNARLADDQGMGTITDRIARLVSPADSSRINDATPRFVWRAADGATAYRLQIDNNADFSSAVLSRIITSTAYTLTEELGNRRYYWRVRAKNSSGQWGAWSEVWSFIVDTRAPDVPVLRSPANNATIRDDTPTFDWKGVDGADRYQLQVDNNADFSSPVIAITTSATSYTRPTSLGDRVYYWRVMARDAAGNGSGWSPTRSFTVNAVRPEPEATATLSPTRIPTETPTLTPTPTEILIEPLPRVESDHPAVQQSGNWISHITDAASGGSYLYSSGSFDDMLTLAFVGTQIEVIYIKHPALGTFAVEIDGTVMQIVDSVAPESEFGMVAVVSGLADGPHTARIYPVAGVIALDAFGVETLPNVTVTPTSTPLPTDMPTQGVTPTDVPPNLPTQTPSATNTPLPMPLPFSDTFDSGLNWIPVGAWTFDTQTAYRGAGWFASSTSRGQSSTLTYDAQIDLRTALNPELSFWQKMTLANEDLFALDVSLDSGLTWQAVESQAGQIMDWTPRTLDLTAYRGQVISLRFRLDTLNALPEGAVTMGMWIDELAIQEAQPTLTPIQIPTETPTQTLSPSVTPSETSSPTTTPTDVPTVTPTETPTPTEIPLETPAPDITEEPAS